MFEMAFYAYNHSDELQKRQGYAAASQRAKHGAKRKQHDELDAAPQAAPPVGASQSQPAVRLPPADRRCCVAPPIGR